ncbi:hypothetical protein VP01_831g4 [Puccinia sorghi]|uniref:Uncharacterized protein n=1 Tax=Puccinia sorghi TaxID=27349 RepID=A0A0L6U9N1_9BASI|nr:hypothetical protein VP01_831g4 [Puccinia sorghi]
MHHIQFSEEAAGLAYRSGNYLSPSHALCLLNISCLCLPNVSCLYTPRNYLESLVILKSFPARVLLILASCLSFDSILDCISQLKGFLLILQQPTGLCVKHPVGDSSFYPTCHEIWTISFSSSQISPKSINHCYHCELRCCSVLFHEGGPPMIEDFCDTHWTFEKAETNEVKNHLVWIILLNVIPHQYVLVFGGWFRLFHGIGWSERPQTCFSSFFPDIYFQQEVRLALSSKKSNQGVEQLVHKFIRLQKHLPLKTTNQSVIGHREYWMDEEEAQLLSSWHCTFKIPGQASHLRDEMFCLKLKLMVFVDIKILIYVGFSQSRESDLKKESNDSTTYLQPHFQKIKKDEKKQKQKVWVIFENVFSTSSHTLNLVLSNKKGLFMSLFDTHFTINFFGCITPAKLPARKPWESFPWELTCNYYFWLWKNNSFTICFEYHSENQVANQFNPNSLLLNILT